MSTTGADAARDALQRAAKEAYAKAFDAGAAFARSHPSIVRATDLVEAMQGMIGFIMAAGRLKDMAEEAEKKAREILASTMADTGAPQIQTDHFIAYLSRRPAFVSIDQEDMIPSEFMKQPPPKPDLAAIKTAIGKGEEVPGATLLHPNSQTLNVRSRHKDAA